MPVIPFTSSGLVAAPDLNGALDNTQQVAFLFTDITINNVSVPAAAPDLTLSLEAAAWYTFDSLLMYSSSTTADIKFTISGPGGTFFGLSGWFADTSASGTTNPLELIMNTAQTNWVQIMGAIGTGTVITARPAGYLVTDTAAGDLTMSFVQNLPEATNTTLKQGSWISLSRVF